MERWKEIKEYPCYLISNKGQVKSLKFGKEKILKGGIDTRGYRMVPLRNKEGRKNMLVHRLVAKAFLSLNIDKPFVNHVNGIKTDNRLENLEWCTQKENVRHSWDNNLCSSKSGVLNGRAILTEKDVIEIKAIVGSNRAEIARKYNVSWSCINSILNGKNWSNI